MFLLATIPILGASGILLIFVIFNKSSRPRLYIESDKSERGRMRGEGGGGYVVLNSIESLPREQSEMSQIVFTNLAYFIFNLL